jgi:hypothetical protein
MKLPKDLRHPSGGDTIDSTARDAVRLAHSALDRFPDLVRRHKFLAGGAALSSALVALAGVAVAKRMRQGQSADEALASVTEAELEGLRVVEVTAEPDDETAETDELEAVDQPASNGRAASTAQTASSDVPAGSETLPSDAAEGSGTTHSA